MIIKESKERKEIQYQQSDYAGNYKLASLFSDLSDLATRNATEIGFWKKEYQKKYGWVLSKQTLKLKRPIKYEEVIYLVTKPAKASRIKFTRDYGIMDENENIIGGVHSIWTFLDLVERKLIRPESIGVEVPNVDEEPYYVDSFVNIDKDVEMTFVGKRQVLYSDVDINQHMGNYRYVEWANDALDTNMFKDHFVEEVSMVYKKELSFEDNVDIYVGKKDNYFKVQIIKDESVHFEMSVKFKKKS